MARSADALQCVTPLTEDLGTAPQASINISKIEYEDR